MPNCELFLITFLGSLLGIRKTKQNYSMQLCTFSLSCFRMTVTKAGSEDWSASNHWHRGAASAAVSLLGARSETRGFLLCHRPLPPLGGATAHIQHRFETETFMMPGAEGQKHLGAVRVTVPRTVLTEASRTNLLTVPFSSQRFPQWRHSHRDEFPSCHSSWQWPRCECCHHVFHVSASGSVLPDQSQHRLGVCEPPDLPGNDSLLEWSNPRTHHRGSWFAQNTLQISFIFFIS